MGASPLATTAARRGCGASKSSVMKYYLCIRNVKESSYGSSLSLITSLSVCYNWAGCLPRAAWRKRRKATRHHRAPLSR